jgi:hypothetical protein
VGSVGADYTSNLGERELETLVQMRSAPRPTEVLRGGGVSSGQSKETEFSMSRGGAARKEVLAEINQPWS